MLGLLLKKEGEEKSPCFLFFSLVDSDVLKAILCKLDLFALALMHSIGVFDA